MREFGKELAGARQASRYPHRGDFALRSGVPISTYEKYELGERFPSKKALDKMLGSGIFEDSVVQHLRKIYNGELALRSGVDLAQTRFAVDVSDLAVKIQHDIEYELKRAHNFKPSPRTRKVCIRRIELRLRNSTETE